MSIMEISIDSEKCPVPAECRICLRICPQAIFKLIPTKVEKFKPTDDKDWGLEVWFRDACVGCMDCVKACPKAAIRVKVISTP
jgi:NADH-quinone oxidoreductase subunit I